MRNVKLLTSGEDNDKVLRNHSLLHSVCILDALSCRPQE